MKRTAAAAVAYALIVFAAGFVLGALRTRLVAPRTGAVAAVLVETPVILAISWQVARWCVQRFGVAARMPQRVAMGAIALALLLLAELALSVAVFQRSIAEHFAAYRTAPVLIGLAAQLVFAAIPSLQARIDRAPP